MFWSKLWLILVCLACGVAASVAMLAPRPLGRDLERESGARLERAQHAASLLLKVNARKWMDTAAQVATDAVLVESLEQATRGPADLGLVHKTVQERLRYFNDKMRVDLVVATDGKGRVIARAGLDEGEYKDFVDGFPLVADALRGLRGDDTWSLAGKLYRVAASPVIARDRYAGSLVVGQEVGNELAQSMKQVLDVDVAFLLRGRVLASSSQLPVLSRLPMLVDQQATAFERSGHSPALPLDGADKPYLVVLAPFVGEAAGHRAVYALLLPRPGAANIGALVGELLQSDPKTLPWPQLAPIGGGVLLALILGIVFMRLESDRPLKRLSREAQALARGEVQRLDDDRHPGKLGAVARAINITLDRLAASQQRAAMKPPESMHRPSPTGQGPSLFGEGLNDSSSGSMPPPPSPSRRDLSPPPVRREPTPPPLRREIPPTMTRPGTPVPAPKPLELREGRLDPPSFGPPRDENSVAEATSPKLSMEDTDAQVTNVVAPDEGPDLIDAPNMLPPLSETTGATRRVPTPRPMPQPQAVQSATVFGDDEPTTTAGAASHLRQMVAAEKRLAAVPPAPVVPKLSPEDEALESELQQVYHDFIETKQRLGETTEGVTYDKFVVKLKANRTQLISRYSCKTVKFQVYVKDGKAALKATPVQT